MAGAIRTFRDNVTRRMLEELQLRVGPQDVIRSGGPGYRLVNWIEVQASEEG